MSVNGPSFLRVVVNKDIVYVFSVLFQLLLLYLDYDYSFVSFIVWIQLPCIMTTMSSVFLSLLCTLFASWLLLDSHPFSFWSASLISHFKQKSPPTSPHPPKHCLTAAEDAPAAFDSLVAPPTSLSLSMHGIQIISRASLCCCMEGMGVFELDLLDNIRSTQISFHARLFHADGAAHTGMLIWLLLFLRKFERVTSNSPSSMCYS